MLRKRNEFPIGSNDGANPEEVCANYVRCDDVCLLAAVRHSESLDSGRETGKSGNTNA